MAFQSQYLLHYRTVEETVGFHIYQVKIDRDEILASFLNQISRNLSISISN